MQQRWNLFRLKFLLSLRTLGWLFRRWQYALLAVLFAVLFFELVYWLFNLGLLGSLLGSRNLTIGDKFRLLASPFTAVKDASGTGLFIMMAVISIVQGLSLSALIYAIKHQSKVDSELLGGGVIVGLLAVIGLGCPACGTSLLLPIVTTFASGSAVAISEKITLISMPIAIIVGLYGLYVLGLRISTIRAQNNFKK